mmetsp:Transcript_125489/g.354995  ORF Transcript_125489/g.354995 Transcript_125489/m.354995 type:complete len:394 (+) Transcript_125489:246-1427(+)
MRHAPGAKLIHHSCEVLVAVCIRHVQATPPQLTGAALETAADPVSNAPKQLIVGLPRGDHGLQLLGGPLLLGGAARVLVLAARHHQRDLPDIHSARVGSPGGLCPATLRAELEVPERLELEGHVAEGGDVALVGSQCHALHLGADALCRGRAKVAVFHPRDGKQVPQACFQRLSANCVVGGAVVPPRGLPRVGGGDREDLLVGREAGEHRAALARLHVEEQLLVHVPLLHLPERLRQLPAVQLRAVGECDDANATVVDKIQEYTVLSCAPEHLPARGHAGLIPRDDAEEELCGHGLPAVVHPAPLVDVGCITPRLVEELPGKWVLVAGGNIVLHHQDDILGGDPSLQHHVVGVARVGLVPVVPVPGGARRDHGPPLRTRRGGRRCLDVRCHLA